MSATAQKYRSYLDYTFKLAWRQRRRVTALMVLMALVTVTRLGEPYLYKVIVDTLTSGIVAKVFSAGQIKILMGSVGIWAVLAIVTNIGDSWKHFLSWELGNQSSQWVHMDGYRRLLRLDHQQHTKRHSSRYTQIVDDADTSIWEMTHWWFGRFIPAGIGFVAMLILAFTISVPMTLVALSVIPPGLLIVVFMINKYEQEQRATNKLWKLKHEHMADQVANIVTYKLNQDEKRFIAIQKAYSHRAQHKQTMLNKKWRLAQMLNVDSLARFVILGMGIFLVKDGAITLGTLFMFMGLLGEILMPLHLMGDILPQYSRRARYIEKQLHLMAQKDSIVDPRRPKKIEKMNGKIELRDVIFRYNPEEAKGFFMDRISLVIEPGQHVAIVGHSGSGKSTIMGLMTRLMDVTEGAVLIDDVDIRDVTQEDLRRHLGVVLQENALYNETVAENIAYGHPQATRRQIVAACRRAAAHEFIKRLPKGYDTSIGERGVRLSGGEKQRLAIARAILKNPRIVILDEPTSALDSITEARVQRGLDELIKNRTAVVIAHRLSTVRNADKIIVLEGGRLIAYGSHLELLRSSPIYSEMVELQTGGFLADE